MSSQETLLADLAGELPTRTAVADAPAQPRASLLVQGKEVPQSIGGILDMYITHWLITTVFVAGSIMLMDRYAVLPTNKQPSAWNDLFYGFGGLAILVALVFWIVLPFAWWGNWALIIARDSAKYHWLHALSIFSSIFIMAWGTFALIVTFGSTLTRGSQADSQEVAGWFMVLLATLYSWIMVIRSFSGMHEKSGVTATVTRTDAQPRKESTPPDTSQVASFVRQSSPTIIGAPATQAAMFGGGSGFGSGLDLGDLFAPSSLSVTKPPPPAATAPMQAGGAYLPAGTSGSPIFIIGGAAPATAAGCAPGSQIRVA